MTPSVWSMARSIAACQALEPSLESIRVAKLSARTAEQDAERAIRVARHCGLRRGSDRCLYRGTTSTKAFLCKSLSRRSPSYYVWDIAIAQAVLS